MENINREERTKTSSVRKKKSVERLLVKRKAFADRNNIPAFSVRQISVAASGKENETGQQNRTSLKVANGNEVLLEPVPIPSFLSTWKKLQNFPLVKENKETGNAIEFDSELDLSSVQDGDSESVSLKQETEFNEVNVPMVQEQGSVYNYGNRFDQARKRRTLNILEHFESLLFVEDYKKDIVHNLQEREKDLCFRNVPQCPQFAKLHAVIVNWLTKLTSDLGLQDELLFITITLLDRLFTKVYISVNKLQVVAVACLWVAIKQNTNWFALASELISICKITTSVRELLYMEIILLSKLNFNITVIDPHLFVNYYLNEMHIKEMRIKHTCRYLLDIILLNSKYSTMYPSHVGSAAVYTALSIFGKKSLWATMQEHKEFHEPYEFSHISDAMVRGLKMICLGEAKFRAAYSKHRKTSSGKISKRLVVTQNEITFL